MGSEMCIRDRDACLWGCAIFDSSSAHISAHGELKEQHEVAPVALMHVHPRMGLGIYI